MSKTLIRRPAGLGEPLGRYSHVSIVRGGDLVFIAGQVGLVESGELAGQGSFADQVRQAFANVGTALAAAGAHPADVVKMSTFIVGGENLDDFMLTRAEVFADMFPAGEYPPNTILFVSRLVEERLLVEIEAVAVVNDAEA